MKKILSLLLVFLLLTASLVSCGEKDSPYDHPEKYITLPNLATIKVKNSDVEESYKEVMQDLLEDMTGEHFYRITGKDAIVQKGDKVHISYTGKSTDSSVTLSENALSAINASESDRVFVIPGAGEVSSAVEDILIGSKIGSELSVSVSYTDEDTDIEELIGKEVVFVIKVHSISRLTITERHSVKLSYTAKLADESVPLDTILKLLEASTETVDLSDSKDTFDKVFSVSEITPLLLGKHKYDTISFTLTLPAAESANYGYSKDVAIAFEATILEASETPTLLTDEMVESVTDGQFTTVKDYESYCLNQVKEELAFVAVAAAATYNDDFPKALYTEFYNDNYQEALYEYAGIGTSYTTEEIEALLPKESLATIKTSVEQSTITELRERFLLEYLFDHFKLSLTKEEYTSALQELYVFYQTEYYYALISYGIGTIEAFEEMLGKDYLEVQFLYQKLPPLLKEAIQFVNE